MHMKMFAVLCAVGACAAAPAFAQTSAPSSSPPSSGNMGQTLQQDLQKAGFTDVKVMPEVYMVRAKDSHGNPVMMRIGPDSIVEMSEVPPTNTSGSAGAKAGGTTPPASTTK